MCGMHHSKKMERCFKDIYKEDLRSLGGGFIYCLCHVYTRQHQASEVCGTAGAVMRAV